MFTKMTNHPASYIARRGGPITFTVAATGNGALSYQWYFNGNPIQGASGSSYTIPSVAASDAGSYTVVVSDLTGSTTSATATLSLITGSSVFFDFNAPDQFANNFQIS